MAATICPTSEQLKALSLGKLSTEESDDLLSHVSSCDSCQAELETVDSIDDTLIGSLRDPDELSDYDAEPDCQVAMAKALGALSLGNDVDHSPDSLTSFPQQIGEYEILRPLGQGGMGRVYLARHTKLGRQVALKVLAHHRLGDQRIGERFEVEMQAIGRLSHPHIVTAHDAREIDGTAVLVTEYVDGWDLGQLLQRTGPLSVANACEIVRQVALALQYTSSEGFVHRDVKPSNIILGRNGVVKLLDLGLARFQFGDDDRPDITSTGQAMGTVDYIAPEQVADSRHVDVRADIYSLGCTLFKLLTGTAPFADDQHATAFAKMTAHVSAAPPSLSDRCPEAPSKLMKLVDSMLAKEPERRPQSPQLVAEALAPLGKGSDLTQLVELAEKSEAVSIAAQPIPASQFARPQPFLRRRVPVGMLIATGLVALAAGFFLGVIVKIKYQDGTVAEVHAPDGSEVSIAPDRSGSTSLNDPQAAAIGDPIPLPRPDSAKEEQIREFAPLIFAIVDDQDHDPNVVWSDDDGPVAVGPVITDDVTWYPVAPHVTVRNSIVHFHQRYAPVEREPSARIEWHEILGHTSGQTTGGLHGLGIALNFDEELATKMKALSQTNLNRQMAFIFNDRIVAAPHIRSLFSDRAQISGGFSEEEIRFLMQALSGGLVDPLPDTGQFKAPDIGGNSIPSPENGVQSDNLPQAIPDLVPQPSEEARVAEFAPLFFAIVEDQVSDPPVAWPHDHGPFATDDATWYPVAPDVDIANAVVHAGQGYAPLESDPDARISWQDIQDHTSGQSTSGGGSDETRIHFHFDAELAAKMKKLSEANLNRQLAFVFNNRIVAAPHIRSVIADSARITGQFSREENRFLMQALSGGLVDPLPDAGQRNVPDSKGNWIPPAENGGDANNEALPLDQPVVQPTKNARGAELAPLFFAIVADQDEKLFATAGDHDWTALTFYTEELAQVTWYPLARGVKVPNLIVRGEKRFAPVTRDPKARIEWDDIRGHVSRVSRSDLDDTELVLRFDEELSAKMKHLYKANLGRHVAFIFNNRIIASFYIGGAVDDSAHYAFGNHLSRDEIEFLMQALNGGLVGPLPRAPNDDGAVFSYSMGYRRGHGISAQGVESLGAQHATMNAQAANQLKDIGLALLNYEATHGRLPASAAVKVLPLDDRAPPYSWRVAILPFIERADLYEQYRFDEPWDSENNQKLLDKMPDIFRSPFAPDEQKPGETNYLGFAGPTTALGVEEGVALKEITDGTSNTVLIVETKHAVPWTKPEDLPFEQPEDAKRAIPFANQRLRVLIVDGSIKDVDSKNWREFAKVINRADGETIVNDIFR